METDIRNYSNHFVGHPCLSNSHICLLLGLHGAFNPVFVHKTDSHVSKIKKSIKSLQ